MEAGAGGGGLYDAQRKSIVERKTASIDHDMTQFRAKIDSVVQEMRIEMNFKPRPVGSR